MAWQAYTTKLSEARVGGLSSICGSFRQYFLHISISELDTQKFSENSARFRRKSLGLS